MGSEDFNAGDFMDRLRTFADELGESLDRTLGELDPDDLVRLIGMDVANLKSAGEWLRAQFAAAAAEPSAPPPSPPVSDEAFTAAGPHPLDMPSEEQGRALAALDSGRWTIEEGTEILTARGDGPPPIDAIRVVRELRQRDWISLDGELTTAGRSALSRWLGSAGGS